MTTTKTKTRPILFTDEMVRAILDGRKTMTRRLVKPQPYTVQGELDAAPGMWLFNYKNHEPCPWGKSGDEAWVRESFGSFDAEPWRGTPSPDVARTHYRATEVSPAIFPKRYWKPSIHMPRWASRITLRVTDVRVERLQNISEEDAKAEGCVRPVIGCARDNFFRLWESINGKTYPWASNPWAWCISFERIANGGEP